jgi:hypothetical protein
VITGWVYAYAMDRILAAGIAFAWSAAVAGCGASAGGAPASGSAGERAAVLRVVEAGRRALLAGDGEGACRLLTARAQRRALAFQVDFVPEGTPIPTKRRGVPQTCEQIVRAEWKAEHEDGVDPSWTPDLRAATFRVVSLHGARARVRLQVPEAYGPTVKLSLVRTERGWRIDDSDAIPSGS